MKEFGLAFFDNAHWIFLVFAILMSVAAILIFIALLIGDIPLGEHAKFKRLFKNLTALSVLLCISFCLPRSSDLWEVRVNLIKLNIASPDNVKQGVARINEVAAEMECKYLDKCK